MSEYVPHQHKARPIGCLHDTIFASVELWADDLPDVIVFDGYRYRRDDEPEGDEPLERDCNAMA